MTRTLAAQVKAAGIMTMQHAAAWIAGVPADELRGSWWGHRDGKKIYAALTALEDAPDVLACKLVEGKETFVHRRLWPALARAQRERALWPTPGAEARALLAKVKRAGRLVAKGKPRLELERALLVIGRSEHTPTGAHQVVLVPFESWLPADVARAADGLSLDDALDELARVGFRPTKKATKK